MVETSQELTKKLLDLIEKTGYQILQTNGQRKFGPPRDWVGPPPKGCEVFVGKLPRDLFEDELVPVFSKIGKIFELRLMMDFSGTNRGYGFVTYTKPSDAAAAVRTLNGLEIRPQRHIGVVKSVDNCRLYFGGLPKTKNRRDLVEELQKHNITDVVDIIMYQDRFDKRFNRGFAFVEFRNHRAAAMARRALPGSTKLWDKEVTVDWAEPEPEVDDDLMKKVKIIYARNFNLSTTSETIQDHIERILNFKIERVKKIYDYAFIHFFHRSQADVAFKKLQNIEIDNSRIEIKWAKPVERELYKIQKLSRGNSKFNSFDLSQTLMLYKQQMDKKEYAFSMKEDEGFSSGCAGSSSRDSPIENHNDEESPSSKLDAMCRRYNWAPPSFEYLTFYNEVGTEIWVCRIELPSVGMPLFSMPKAIGPVHSKPCSTKQKAFREAASMLLKHLKMIRHDVIEQSTMSPPVQTSTPIPFYQNTILPPMSNLPMTTNYCLPFNMMNHPLYARPQFYL